MSTQETAATEHDDQAQAPNQDQAQEDVQAQEAPSGEELTREQLEAALEKARREAAKYRVERNELRGDAEKFRELKEAEKSDLQKAEEALQASNGELAVLKAQNARLEAAARYGIAAENIDLLGGDPENFEANAKRLSELQAAAVNRPPSNRPVEGLRPGASPKEDAPDYDYPPSWEVTGPYKKD